MVSRELLDACRRGDSKAFEEVVRLTYRHVYTQALRLVGESHEAEDVAQEAYLRVFRGLSGFRGDAQFETWLYRIVANAAVSHLRRRGRFGQPSADPDQDLATAADEASWQDPSLEDRAVDRDALVHALGELPIGLRVPVVLKEVYGMSCRE